MPAALESNILIRYLTRAGGTSRRWARLVEANRQLAVAKDEAVEIHRSRSAFLANLSHQIRTPLSTILLCSELLGDELAERGVIPTSGDLENIQSAGKHLLDLLDDILDLTRMEAGGMVFRQEDTDPAPMVQALATAFHALAQGQGDTLLMRLSPGLPKLRTDPGKLEQILHHLLHNALKFTREGTVTLEVTACEAGTLCFTVTDTGEGMSAEKLETIRRDFAQSPAPRHDTFGQAGLGLTLCRRLAEGLGGRLQADSRQGAGSSFRLLLPAAGAPA